MANLSICPHGWINFCFIYFEATLLDTSDLKLLHIYNQLNLLSMCSELFVISKNVLVLKANLAEIHIHLRCVYYLFSVQFGSLSISTGSYSLFTLVVAPHIFGFISTILV